MPPTLVPPQDEFDVDIERIDDGVEGDIETEVEGDGTLRMRNGNGPLKSRKPAAHLFDSHSLSSSSLSSSASSSRNPTYHFTDHTELEGGSGRGWLRISDDSVQEVGIESVLSETGSVFMLYYERVLQPDVIRPYRGARTPLGTERHLNGGSVWNGSTSYASGRAGGSMLVRSGNGNVTESEDETGTETDADGFSIGSEETLKPQTKVVDLNGSVGSLVSEVGVGVMKKGKDKEKNGKEKEKSVEKMTMSMYSNGSSASSSYSGYSSSSKGVGARIIRNVSAGRRLVSSPSLSSSPSSTHTNGHARERGLLFSSPAPALSDVDSRRTSLEPQPLPNGDVPNGSDEHVPYEMIASAPSILDGLRATSNGPLNASTSALGSRATKILHRQPMGTVTSPGVKVKAR